MYVTAAGDMYDTDMDDKMGLTRTPAKPPLQDDGLDIQATQAGVSEPHSTPPLPLPRLGNLLGFSASSTW